MSLQRHTRKLALVHKSLLGILAMTALFSAPVLGQSILYDQTFTGAELLTAPGVSFPTRTPMVVGSSLEFGTGVATREVLMRLPLAPAGAASGSTSVLACYEITLTPLTADNDTSWQLGDGAFLVGGGVADNSGGSGNAASWVDPPPVAPLEVTTLYTGAGTPPVGTSHTAMINILSNDLETTVESAFGTGAGSAPLTATVDRTQALELVLLIDEAPEQFRVESLRARLVRDATGFENCATLPVVSIPTTSEWGLMILSVLLLAAGALFLRR
jgi:hypothetical protein